MRLDEDEVNSIAEALPSAAELLPQFPELLALLAGRRQKLFAAAAALQVATFTAARPTAIPARTRAVTFGFIPLGPVLAGAFGPASGYPLGRRFTFGVSVYADPVAGAPIQEVTDRLALAGQAFPVVVTRSSLNRDNLPPHPGSPSGIGSSACWVKSTNASSGWTHGVMTARHVVKALSVGTRVALDRSPAHASPTRSSVADLGACSIDAAVLEIDPQDWPAGRRRLGLGGSFAAPIAPADPVELEGRFASGKTGKTISHHPLPHYWGSMMGQRLVIDVHGRGGDSGGLVTHTASGKGVGLYMGRIADGAGGHQGLCQDLYQASIYLEADPYQ